MMSKEIRGLSDLIGEEVSSVCFVRDYVEFHFDGPILRSLSNPILVRGATEYRFPDPGSRDELCRIVGATVRDVTMKESESFELAMSNDYRLVVPLDAKSLRWPEAMHFVPKQNGPIQVW